MEQKNQLLHTHQRVSRLQQELRELKTSSKDMTPQYLLARLDEEACLKKVLAQETLPKNIEARRKECVEVERVLMEPLMSDGDLDTVRQQLDEANAELARLMEKYMPGNDPEQDKLALFRQQASIIAHKKEAEVNDYKAALDDLASAERELKVREERLKQMEGGGQVVKEEEFKRYVAKLRKLNNLYRKKKQEISFLKAEFGVLSRTEEVLRSRDENLQEVIAILEEKKGVRGYVQTQETLEQVSAAKRELDEQKGTKLSEMTKTIDELTEAITAKKALLAPLIKEIKPLRQQHQELQAIHAEKKVTYDTVYAGVDAKKSHLELEVRSYWEEKTAHESQYHYLQAMKQSIELQQQKVAAEMKSYMGRDMEKNEKRRSLRDQYTRKIQEQENLGRALRDKQTEVRKNHAHNMQQVKMWQDLRSLLKAKKDSYEAARLQRNEEKAAQKVMLENPDRLVVS